MVVNFILNYFLMQLQFQNFYRVRWHKYSVEGYIYMKERMFTNGCLHGDDPEDDGADARMCSV